MLSPGACEASVIPDTGAVSVYGHMFWCARVCSFLASNDSEVVYYNIIGNIISGVVGTHLLSIFEITKVNNKQQ